MKKKIMACLCMVVALSMTGCGNAETTEIENMQAEVQVEEQTEEKDNTETDAQDGEEVNYVELGNKYYNGEGVEVDYAKAAENFENAIANGDYSCAGILGNMYNIGQGVAVDKQKAFEYYKLAVENGADASYERGVALCYLNGEGVEQNTELADRKSVV